MSDSSPNKNQPFDYTVAEWLRDFGELFRISVLAQNKPANDLVDLHFANQYPDFAERAYRRLRLIKAYSFLKDNVEHFNFGKSGVVSKDDALIGKPAVMALYQLFSHASDIDLKIEPPIDLAVQLAKSWEG